jgi:hypothetical protein
MLVPSLSPSGSWLWPDMYVDAGYVTLITVKVIAATFLAIAAAASVHRPLPLVVHEPARPLLHVPVTVAFDRGACAPSCTVTVTDALHVLCCALAAPSRSPACTVGEATITFAECAVVAPPLSVTVSVTV